MWRSIVSFPVRPGRKRIWSIPQVQKSNSRPAVLYSVVYSVCQLRIPYVFWLDLLETRNIDMAHLGQPLLPPRHSVDADVILLTNFGWLFCWRLEWPVYVLLLCWNMQYLGHLSSDGERETTCRISLWRSTATDLSRIQCAWRTRWKWRCAASRSNLPTAVLVLANGGMCPLFQVQLRVRL